MRRFIRKTLWRALRRRLPAALTLIAYLIAALGVPVPAESRSGNGVKACGCSTEECHDGQCCCAPKPAPPKPTGTCCEHKPGCMMPCCQHRPPADPPKPPVKPTEPQPPANEDDDASGSVTVLVGIAAMKCRGHSTLWVSTGASLPVPAVVAWQPAFVLEGWMPTTSEHAGSINSIPPVPPPRSGDALISL
jgi:hypothetical protein